ncbi:MAG: pseudouridine synthase [Candidatus Gastranaerophilaceae bacterium]|jgi:23S rRNA pseudouridine2605 synthase|nr:pseudouridine synthase [Christensenellales bacterium]
MRLQKFMADAGVASRRKCEEIISQGRVSVNGRVAAIGMRVEPDKDNVLLDGTPIYIVGQKVTIMFNKPRGMVCTASDPEGRKTVMDVFKALPYRLYNVGRLDIDSEGLILVTNDGELANGIMHPSRMIDKTYRVICGGIISDEDRATLEKGVLLDDGITSPARVDGIRRLDEDSTELYITIHEGRNRQVRRMLDAIGHKTLRLRRVRLGNLRLGGLKSGDWRYLTREEVESLSKLVLNK